MTKRRDGRTHHVCARHILSALAVACLVAADARSARAADALDGVRDDLADAQRLYTETTHYDEVLRICERVLSVAEGHRGEWRAIARASVYEARAWLLSGFAHERLGGVGDAIRAYRIYLERFAGEPESRRTDAATSLAALERLGFVALEQRPAGARIEIDGSVASVGRDGRLALAAGRHSLVASAAGYVASRHTLIVEAGQEQALTIALTPEVASRGQWQRTAAWVTTGLGVAALTTGIVCFALANDKRTTIANAMDEDGRVSEDVLTQRTAFELSAAADDLDIGGIAGVVTGAVAGVAAAVLFLVPSGSDATERGAAAKPAAGPNRAGPRVVGATWDF